MKAEKAPLPRILVLASGSGTNVQALIDATRERDFPGRIVAVGSNRPKAFALERAAQANIETFVVDHTQYDSREAFDAALMAEIRRYNPDVLLLAGFMRILTDDFVRAFRGILLNIHPSLLPKYTGLNTHQRALEAGDPVHGTSVHFVTEELDGGPVIAQAEVKVSPEDTPESLAEKVKAKEHILYPIVVRWFCEGRIQLGSDYILFDGELLKAPLRLTDD
ncbi:phosphoribosylglycinamide formyltransferase [Marinobacter lutaoensis]|jgi:phosphoribosylglycinamide formyltransferase-1|uniref:phosphoribosylglycinamide formyltransferase n=1 Tax=Marinobacter lutaoensis TaxID=135739 RepID=UPI000C0B381A|nr:phosphoribosylglycinamide formyltransferase [Marinobacter lutaoensis]MBE02933.1 phosphoribosylglycinamide formyltransferase [Marinobacter sp.]MBI42007.1 phosphoribosylglycinamide formyltransferase [Oceanospirillales bacterium]NVD36596.1 phosphoribosylglycinamide formyltransferase [Marinobacter lutaoensis]|tara:strand:+ start:2593 stop:3255 length:663 start_codon:yes stop_codon:yes gene_type:complete